MAGMRMSMRKIREVLRLTHELGLSVRQVCEATGVGKTAVSEYVSRAKVVGITWPIPPEITDADLERRLFPPPGFHYGSTKPVPDWTTVHQELKRRGVTVYSAGARTSPQPAVINKLGERIICDSTTILDCNPSLRCGRSRSPGPARRWAET